MGHHGCMPTMSTTPGTPTAATEASPVTAAWLWVPAVAAALWLALKVVRPALHAVLDRAPSAVRLRSSQRLALAASVIPPTAATFLCLFEGIAVATGSRLAASVLRWGVMAIAAAGAALWAAAQVAGHAERRAGNRFRAELGLVKIRSRMKPATAARWVAALWVPVWIASTEGAITLVSRIADTTQVPTWWATFYWSSAVNAMGALMATGWVRRRQRRRVAAEQQRAQSADAARAVDPGDLRATG